MSSSASRPKRLPGGCRSAQTLGVTPSLRLGAVVSHRRRHRLASSSAASSARIRGSASTPMRSPAVHVRPRGLHPSRFRAKRVRQRSGAFAAWSRAPSSPPTGPSLASRFQLGSGAAARRRPLLAVVPAFAVAHTGAPRYIGFMPCPPVRAFEVTPNPSLERTLTGKPRWPRSGVVHHPLRGQRVSPARAAQLKR